MEPAIVLWILVAAMAAPTSRAEPVAQTVKAQDLSDGQMEAFLAEGEIVRSRSVGSGVTGSLRATLRRNGVEHEAHIQSIDLTKPIGSMSAGAAIDFRDSYRNNWRPTAWTDPWGSPWSRSR